jgi:dephospho-CoA kinase
MRRTEVAAILSVQVTRGERLAGADDVLDNDGDLVQLRVAVHALHGVYLGLAQQPQPSPE